MKSIKKTLKAAAAAVAALVTVTACSATGGAPRASDNPNGQAGGVDTPRYTVAMITHGAPGDTFWDLVRKGAEDAARKNNIELRYSSDPEAPNQANLVQNAIDSRVDGIAVTLPNADAIGPVARKAADKKIPIVALNAGMDAYQKYNISAFFGQEEKVAGTLAGERLAKDGARHALCVIHEQGNSSQEARCAGVKQGMSGNVETLYVNGKDLTSVQSTVQAKLSQDKSIDWVMGLQAPVAMTSAEAVKNAGSAAKVATFDTNAQLVDAISSGAIAWAVDQQPYMQGYLAVDSIWLAHRNGSTMGGGRPVYTGPSFVDSSNVDAISEAAKAGLR
ncbi:substrate-binding domain-containing protein [Corynebacterium diphtheriae]|uniref:Sugar ABC transporter substrate-binding protein n=1 Tax=Corynebacterium diphtheriae TaxID=1717 RepID=A0A811FXZ8_CORDP|nr:substrate-binding domain-containing protein [Corynebacterium diphtheriae]MBG9303382.1 substrate-binding domain-containing protein [Corynebacterium diphtheriae bv. mitis]MBG9305988.1 substrate-binding domain-containing protein [Corynebacterium diphtheriae bv. mitis]OIS22866.1 sugar ABC transporter substrate-binding protein [Corynebacterium diphtheriae]OLN15878.1 sugar ABC transporter substrate-binding protein [Corynebacterium diphtheriae]OSQ23662.1 sugar ABC transporter substrate-binding pro